MFGPFFLLVFVLASASGPLLISAAPDNDRDFMIGQVPVKKTPINILNNATFDPFDFSGNKGCKGKNCKSTTNQQYRQNANTYWGDSGDSDELDLCDLPRDYGDCAHRIIRWYFDRRDGFCRRFIYSGCGGNGNNFQGRRRCHEQCTGLYGSDSGRRSGNGGRHGNRGGGGWGSEEEDDMEDLSEEVDYEEHSERMEGHDKKKPAGKHGGGKRTVYTKTVVEEDADSEE